MAGGGGGRPSKAVESLGNVYGALAVVGVVYRHRRHLLVCECIRCGSVSVKLDPTWVRKGTAMSCSRACYARYRGEQRKAKREQKLQGLFPEGLRIHNLTVLRIGDDLKTVRVRCDCGKEATRYVGDLLCGKAKQCSFKCRLSVSKLSRRKPTGPVKSEVPVERKPAKTWVGVEPTRHYAGPNCPCHPCRMMRQMDKVLALRKQLRAMGRVA